MDKEERKKLEKEYEKFWAKKAYGNKIWYPTYISVGASLIIFLIPTNLLSMYPSLKIITEFMATLFPNISIYTQKSELTEITEFYFSYMWIVLILTMLLTIFAIPKTNEEAERYFGTGKYKGKEILPHKFIIVMQSFFNLKYIPYYLATILLFGIVVYMNYTGSLIDGGISKLRFGEVISTRFGMFFIGNIFQNFVLYIIFIPTITIVLNTIHIKKIKKGE